MLKYCHYFNNAKKCPFEENGCMFIHEMSPLCRFNVKCDNTLCQFRHPKIQNEESENESTSKDDNIQHIDEHESDDDQSEELFPCDSCDKIYDEIDDLIEHYGETAHNI